MPYSYTFVINIIISNCRCLVNTLYSKIGVTVFEALTNKYPYGEIEPIQSPNFKDAILPRSLNNNIPLWLESVILRSISVEQNQRYNNYTEMMYEVENTHKVKAFFSKSTPLMKRNPILVYKIGFYLMFTLNMYLIFN